MGKYIWHETGYAEECLPCKAVVGCSFRIYYRSPSCMCVSERERDITSLKKLQYGVFIVK